MVIKKKEPVGEYKTIRSGNFAGKSGGTSAYSLPINTLSNI